MKSIVCFLLLMQFSALQAQEIVDNWKYTLRKPDQGWRTAKFDDAGWTDASGGFGTRDTPGSRVGTVWATNSIWMRKSFDVANVPAKPALLIHHDENAEVFLNGKLVAAVKGFTSKYIVVPIPDEKQGAIRSGRNVMAVHCSQTQGGQFIDAHLIDADNVPKLPAAKRSTKPFQSELITKWGEAVTPENAWTEYPRPQMQRDNWTNLNGDWNYAVTPIKQEETPSEWDGEVLVPFCLESKLGGVQRLLDSTEALWYSRNFAAKKSAGKRQLLNFEAVDYRCEVFVNGKSVGSHVGGNLPFSFDVTDALKDGENKLVVRVEDDTEKFQLRGKQALNARGIWYTQNSGIWQTVWLEEVPELFVQRVKVDTKTSGEVSVKVATEGRIAGKLEVTAIARLDGKEVARATGPSDSLSLKIADPKLWTPNSPTLYDLEIRVKDDVVHSYFGVREVGKVKDADGHWRFTLNGDVAFHWGPLDQGWWPDGLLTPPSDEAMLFDIEWLKESGFNMIRKHIKVEPRRYYYHCDRLGMMVWQDQVSGGKNPKWYRLDPTKNKNHSTPELGDPIDAEWPDADHEQWMTELKGMIDHLYNYPSIVMWVPFNEAWGQHRTMEVGEWIMKYDPSRSINIASGGNFAPVGDIADMHSYPHPAFPFHMNEYDDYIKVVGELGGHGWKVDGHEWDPKKKNFIYGDMPKTIDEYAERYAESIRLLGELKAQGISGGVYTQTTDIEGEINGLMTYDRKVIKIPAKELAGIHRQLFKPMAMADNAANLPKVSEEGIPKKQPNFIVILTDDQGWGTTSITVDPAVPESKSDFFKTPNLEKLASQGLRFTQAYSGHPNCSPSRAALLTGRSPAALHFTDICGRNGGGLYVGNKIIPPQHINALPEGELTLPEIIKQHLPAYKAAHFGKWHLGKVGPEGHGFDAGDGPTGNREGSGKDNLPDDPKRIFSVTKRANDWMAEQAKGKQPFYLQVSHYATHLGLQSRPETKQRLDKRPSGTRHQNTEFGAMIEDMDDGIGQLLAKVKELGIGDNTYIFYTADNGTFPLEEPGNINGPLRGNKATVWEAGVRVPFIIAGPGIKSGTVSRAPAVGYDIYPTICDILGIADLPEQVEGGSLQPVWAAKAASVKRSRPQLVFHWPHYQHQKKSIPDSTVLLDGYKLHYFWETGKAELYNLKTDLAETKDLSRSMPDKAKELEGLLHSHLKEINAQIPELNKDYDPATDPALVKAKKPKDNKKKKNRS